MAGPRRETASSGDREFALRTLGTAQLYESSAAHPQHVAVPLVGKQFALLAYLASVSHRAESRATLTALFAPDGATHARSSTGDAGEKKAADAVRDLIRQLRSKLGRESLGGLGDDPVRLTAALVSDRDDLLDAWKRHDYRAVVAAYKGEFLPRFEGVAGAEFALWLESERADLGRRFAQAARHVLAIDFATSNDKETLSHAAQIARQLRDHDVLAQDAWQQLIRYLVLSGDHDEAALEAEHLQAFFAAKQIELEIATRRAISLARAEAAGARLAASHAQAASPTADGGHLVRRLIGRDAELSTLVAAWDRARAGSLVHIHLQGDAGLGKTRLLTELRQRLRARPSGGGGIRAIEVGAVQRARDTRFAFVADLAHRLAERPGGLGISESAATTLVMLHPALADLYKGARARRGPNALSTFDTIEAALHELIGAVALDGPIALLLDDVHWADADSQRVIAGVMQASAQLPVLIVSAGRDAADTLSGATRARRIELTPLGVTGIESAITQIAPLPATAWARDLPRQLWEATAGSPMRLHETLQLLDEASLLSIGPDGWRAPDPAALAEQLRNGNATRRRIDQLTPSERRLLLLLSVGGSAVATHRLRAASRLETASFNASLTSLEKRGFVARHGDEWSVAHDEHARATREAFTPPEGDAAAAELGRVILLDAHDDPRELCRAGALLARNGDSSELRSAFVRFVRLARAHHDARPMRELAREFLGDAATESELLASVIRRVPLSARAGPTWRYRVALGGAMTALLLIGAFVAAPILRPAAPPPDAVLVAGRFAPDRKAFDAFPVPIDASHWAGVRVLDVPLSGRPMRRAMLLNNGGIDLRPDHRGWTGGVSVPDSGVIDIYDFDLEGNAHRLTYTKMDDLQPSWAPDNSRFVFVTARWSQRGHYDLAVYDTLTRGVRHLTEGDDTDQDPHWSPDGSRIAFVRREAGSWRSMLCLIDADGNGLRCLPAEGATGLVIAGWADAHRIWLRRGYGGDNSRLERVDVEAGRVDASDTRDDAATISPDARFGMCTCPRPGYPAGTTIVFPLERPDEFAVLKPAGVDPRTIEYSWAPATPRLPYVARLQIDTGLGSPLLGMSYQLRASGRDTSNVVVTPGVVRWRSGDTTMATVDSTGLLVPHRAGRVTIDASAGGWRATRMTLSIGNAPSRVLLDEHWSNGLTTTWTTYGIPKPIVQPDARFGHAFLNNGDGSFFSGAYTTRAYPTRDGLWVEATLSTPLTARESQEQVLWLFSMSDSAAWANWDHVTGDGPIARASPGWSIRYPLGVNTDRVGQHIGIFGFSQHVLRPVPPDAYTGRPFRLVMQIFPDGRCGVAVDGKVLWIGPADFLRPSVRLMLSGNSVDTRILVGPVRLATGIAPGIDWSGY
jgi:hypothetical protein